MIHIVHIDLLAGYGKAGHAVREPLPVRPTGDGGYEVLGTPGLATGCAAGDVIEVQPDGAYRVLCRGGNVAIHAVRDGTFTEAEYTLLADAFGALDGLVESPKDRRFLVVTVPVGAGFEAIEAAITGWCAATPGADWMYGNVFADDGETPLNWWRADP